MASGRLPVLGRSLKGGAPKRLVQAATGLVGVGRGALLGFVGGIESG